MRYLQESSNLQLSLLRSSPKELGWHPSCLRLPTQFSLTARVQRTAQEGCLSIMLPLPHQSRRLRLSLAAWNNAVFFSSMRILICKGIFFWCRTSATHTMTFPVSIFTWEERQHSLPHTPSPGNFILCKIKYTILYNSWRAFIMPSPPVTSWKCLFRLLACSQITFPTQVTCLLRISALFKSTSFQLELKPFLFWWMFCIVAGALTRTVPQTAFSYFHRVHGRLAQAMNWETPNLYFLIKKQYLLRWLQFL